MAFTNKEFPGRLFESLEEYEKAKTLSRHLEREMVRRGQQEGITKVTAVILPAPREVLEARIAKLEARVEELTQKLQAENFPEPKQIYPGASIKDLNAEGLPPGLVLKGQSKGVRHSLEVLQEGYLCSDGNIYPSLSGAALGVSGNRRSGWRFWEDEDGRPIGEVTGRFEAHVGTS